MFLVIFEQFFNFSFFPVLTGKKGGIKVNVPQIKISIFQENKVSRSTRHVIDFILTKFRNCGFWADFQLCLIFTGNSS
jgi:hypothetical protein